MMDAVTLEHVEALAARLTPEEQARLAEHLLSNLSSSAPSGGQSARMNWMSLRGVAPGLLGGEDAQHWVSRGRHEADVERAKALKPCP